MINKNIANSNTKTAIPINAIKNNMACLLPLDNE